MTTRLTTRVLVRDEIQDLFQQSFNLIESVRGAVYELAGGEVEADDPEFLARISTVVGRLANNYEILRSRVLPIVG